jgi:ATP synthase F1 complex assembly factor 1
MSYSANFHLSPSIYNWRASQSVNTKTSLITNRVNSLPSASSFITMASSSGLAIRKTLRSCSTHLRIQRRFAQVQDVRFVATHGAPERIVDRYKNKLEKKAKEEGLESISQLKEVYKDKIAEARKKASALVPKVAVSSEAAGLRHPPPPPPLPQTETPPKAPKTGVPGIKPLSSYLDLNKVSTLPAKEVEVVWRLRHAREPLSLCAVIPLETYERIYNTAKAHPQFILPLPRPSAEDDTAVAKQSDSGFTGGARTAADIHFLQWGFYPPAGSPPAPEVRTANNHTSTVLFTHLAHYKLHGAYAPPHTTITHHLDLADSHGLVLMNGGVVDGRGVSIEEGRWLLMCLQKFYDFEGHGGGVGKEKRQALLQNFSKGDQGFDLTALVDEAERIL